MKWKSLLITFSAILLMPIENPRASFAIPTDTPVDVPPQPGTPRPPTPLPPDVPPERERLPLNRPETPYSKPSVPPQPGMPQKTVPSRPDALNPAPPPKPKKTLAPLVSPRPGVGNPFLPSSSSNISKNI